MKHTFALITFSIFFLQTLTAQIQKTVSFNGETDYFEVPDNSTIDLTEELTIEAWVLIANPLDGEYTALINKQFCQGQDVAFALGVRDGNFQWSWLDAAEPISCAVPNVYYSTGNNFPSQEWTHIAISHSPNGVKTYINGLLQFGNLTEGAYSGIQNSSQPLKVGVYRNQNGSYTGFFHGFMDEVRIWNRVLSQEEINQNMNESLTGSENNLVVYFNMEDIGAGQGIQMTNSAESTGSINHAIATGGTDFTPFFFNPNSKISAVAYWDENLNNTFDDSEYPLYDQSYLLNPSEQVSLTGFDGQVDFYLDPGSYTLEPFNNNGLWQNVDDDILYSFEINAELFDSSFYFPMNPVGNFIVQDIDLSSSIIRCSQNSNFWITYSNDGSTITNGYVEFIPDSLTQFVSSNPPADSSINGKLYWFYENLPPTHSEQIHLVYKMPTFEFLEEILYFEANIDQWDETGGSKALLSEELLCSYDPNDKLVVPTGVQDENYTLFDEDLMTYTVRFQNTGNDTAFNIIIQDVISPNLDLNTFNFVASSHDCKTVLNLDSRKIQFQFDNIYLPDSFVNEPASHGFVKFQITAKEGLAENTVIENTADIFFDFNPAIVTNTVRNTMVSEIPTGLEAPQFMQQIQVQPNPFSNQTTIKLENSSQNRLTLVIKNANGNIISIEKDIYTNEIQVDRKNMTSGMYFYEILNETGASIGAGKLIVF